MNLGQKLLELRKSKQLSQEEVAEILNVSRQTVSKWETDQSTPDFDKIIPICELYGITPNQLLSLEKEEANEVNNNQGDKQIKKKKASGIGKGILLYFVAIVWIMISIPVLMLNPVLASAIFLLICGVATYIIIYTCIIYKKEHVKKEEKSIKKQIEYILAIIITIIYLLISFATMAWHITWIIWIVYALVIEILKLIIMIRGNENEK